MSPASASAFATTAPHAGRATPSLLKLKIADYEIWKREFSADNATRKAAGIAGHRVFAVLGPPSSLVVAFDVVDPIRASAYLESAAFQAAMRRAGVLGKPAAFRGSVQVVDGF